MSSVVAETCSIPIRKIELLSAELRLLKGAIEQLHGRFELLLAEISDLEDNQVALKEKLPSKSEPAALGQPQVPEISDAASFPIDPDPASLPPVVATAQQLPGLSVGITAAYAQLCAPVDATAVGEGAAEAITPSDPRPIADVETTLNHAITEAAAVEPVLPEVAVEPTIAAGVSADLPVASGDTAPPAPCGPSCAIIVLDERRQSAQRKSRSRLRTASRWAAAIAIIAALATLVAAGAGFASRNGDQPAVDRTCIFGPDICAIVRALPL